MCGITGFFSNSHFFSNNDLEKMTHILSHRGPDATGLFMDSPAGLGHTRLSILDLSEKANQPMHSHNGRFVMVYNGEVYNYREIANELKLHAGKEMLFNTASDSEIILEAFANYGVSFVEKLNGMFAIAIYDKQQKELFLFRDRIGIKPLYYYWDGKNFAFASELKALVALEQLPKKINRTAVRDFLHIGFIPAPDSIYESFHKLDAGSFLKISENNFIIQRYWSLKTNISAHVINDKTQALVKLSDLLISSVQYQLKSDVPVGIFLSGGIDSSLVASQAVQLSNTKVNTFSIGFEENAYNESEYAKKVANYLGTSHHEFMISYKDAYPFVDKMSDAYDEPFSDSSAIPVMLVSKLAKQSVTVALSGEGGDELFFGYGSYVWAKRLHNPVLQFFHNSIASVLKNIPDDRYRRAARRFEYSDYNNIRSHIFSQEQYFFSELELEKIMTDEYKTKKSAIKKLLFSDNIEEHGTVRHLNAMEQQALFDINYYLKNDLLTKLDRASMQFSLETRVPYLDHRIVEFALNISPHLKYKNGISKYILKEILFQYIPEKFFQRKKQGFAIPLCEWLQNELRHLIDDYLNKSVIEQFCVVNYSDVEKLKYDFFAGKKFLYNRLWLLIVLHKFLKEKTNHLI